MPSAALWLQASEGARNELFTTLSVWNTMGRTAARPNNPDDFAPQQRGAPMNERLLAEFERPDFGRRLCISIESSDFTVTSGLFGKDD